jgi:CHASE2 domain-containing sensor protein
MSQRAPSRWLLAATTLAVLAVLAAAGLALTGTLMQPLPPPVVAGVAAAILGAALVADTVKLRVFRRLGIHSSRRSQDGRHPGKGSIRACRVDGCTTPTHRRHG